MGIIVKANEKFVVAEEANNLIRYFIGGTSQSIILLFRTLNTPANPITISFNATFQDKGNAEYSILSDLAPATAYSVTLDSQMGAVIPLPMPLKVNQIIARISGMDMNADTLEVDFVAERSLMAPTGSQSNNVTFVPR